MRANTELPRLAEGIKTELPDRRGGLSAAQSKEQPKPVPETRAPGPSCKDGRLPSPPG